MTNEHFKSIMGGIRQNKSHSVCIKFDSEKISDGGFFDWMSKRWKSVVAVACFTLLMTVGGFCGGLLISGWGLWFLGVRSVTLCAIIAIFCAVGLGAITIYFMGKEENLF